MAAQGAARRCLHHPPLLPPPQLLLLLMLVVVWVAGWSVWHWALWQGPGEEHLPPPAAAVVVWQQVWLNHVASWQLAALPPAPAAALACCPLPCPACHCCWLPLLLLLLFLLLLLHCQVPAVGVCPVCRRVLPAPPSAAGRLLRGRW
jgi:hypothetical protein